MSYGKRFAWQRPSRAPSVERERPLPASALRPEPQDCAEVAPADHDGRCADGAEGSEEHGADASRGSRRGSVPPEDAVAAGRRAGLPEGTFPISAEAPCTVASSGMGISRLPKEEASDKRNRFKSYQIGYGALSRELSLAVRNLQFPVRAQAAVAARHVRNASSRRTRSVWRDVRWRWTLNVL
jgi:hypothetical protein